MSRTYTVPYMASLAVLRSQERGARKYLCDKPIVLFIHQLLAELFIHKLLAEAGLDLPQKLAEVI